MNNTIQATATASLSFDFRGQRFSPSIHIDLHIMMMKQQPIEHLYDLLGASIGLDAYRHEYDVMIMHEITFSEPAGLVSDFIINGTLDFDAFAEAWQKQRALDVVQPIARRHLDIADLDTHPDIRNALIESYQSGQATRSGEKHHPAGSV